MSDHYNHVIKRGVEKMAKGTGQEDDHYEKNAVDKIRASCDRRLSRAAREIVKQKLLQALVVDEQPTKSTTTVATSATASEMSVNWSTISGARRKNHPIMTLQDILASDNPAKFNVWELLESVVFAANSNNTNEVASTSTCPLQAQRDVLRYNEEQVSIIPADLQGRRGVDTPTANRRHVNQKLFAHSPHWYQCLVCGKVFSSRFYLDRHLEAHHRPPETELSKDDISHHHDDDDSTFWICPATDWCGNFLSMSACHEMALTLEPHYGPGSQGRRRQDRVNVERRLWKEAHEQPCTTSGMQTATVSCRNMIQSCFQQQPENADNSDKENNVDAAVLFASQRIGQMLDKSLCSTLSCPDRLRRLFFQTKTGGDLVMRHVHEWQEEWIYWSEDHHEVGWVGFILLLLLAVWYANALLQHLPLRVPRATAFVPSFFRPGGNKRKIPKPQGSRLLRKSPTKTSASRGAKTKEN